MSILSGASVSQLLADITDPRGARTERVFPAMNTVSCYCFTAVSMARWIAKIIRIPFITGHHNVARMAMAGFHWRKLMRRFAAQGVAPTG
jgi:hypothetical protein